MSDADKIITSVEDLDDEDEKEVFPPEAEEASPSEEEEGDASEESEEGSQEKEETSEVPVAESQPSGQENEAIEIDGVTYSKEDLDHIFTIGKSVKEYQKEHPGYDPILLHKDYTKKAQELAELRRAQMAQPQPVATTPEKPKIDLSQFKKEDLDYFEKLASALGYAKSDDIEKSKIEMRRQEYERVKHEEINKFVTDHPEYQIGIEANDLRWNSLLSEFRIYKLPEDPREFGKLLERAHRAISGTTSSFDAKKVSEILAKKKAAASGQSSVGGGAGASQKSSAPKSKKIERLSEIARSGGLVGFSAEELEEMFG